MDYEEQVRKRRSGFFPLSRFIFFFVDSRAIDRWATKKKNNAPPPVGLPPLGQQSQSRLISPDSPSPCRRQ